MHFYRLFVFIFFMLYVSLPYTAFAEESVLFFDKERIGLVDIQSSTVHTIQQFPTELRNAYVHQVNDDMWYFVAVEQLQAPLSNDSLQNRHLGWFHVEKGFGHLKSPVQDIEVISEKYLVVLQGNVWSLLNIQDNSLLPIMDCPAQNKRQFGANERYLTILCEDNQYISNSISSSIVYQINLQTHAIKKQVIADENQQMLLSNSGEKLLLFQAISSANYYEPPKTKLTLMNLMNGMTTLIPMNFSPTPYVDGFGISGLASIYLDQGYGIFTVSSCTECDATPFDRAFSLTEHRYTNKAIDPYEFVPASAKTNVQFQKFPPGFSIEEDVRGMHLENNGKIIFSIPSEQITCDPFPGDDAITAEPYPHGWIFQSTNNPTVFLGTYVSGLYYDTYTDSEIRYCNTDFMLYYSGSTWLTEPMKWTDITLPSFNNYANYSLSSWLSSYWYFEQKTNNGIWFDDWYIPNQGYPQNLKKLLPTGGSILTILPSSWEKPQQHKKIMVFAPAIDPMFTNNHEKVATILEKKIQRLLLENLDNIDIISVPKSSEMSVHKESGTTPSSVQTKNGVLHADMAISTTLLKMDQTNIIVIIVYDITTGTIYNMNKAIISNTAEIDVHVMKTIQEIQRWQTP